MRRDSIFYKLFQQSPALLFQLLATPPINADAYRFDSVAVKEPKFEIDGVFLLPESDIPGVIYFCEVQFQKAETPYSRVPLRKEYLQKHHCTSTATVPDLATGKQLSSILRAVSNKAIFTLIGNF